MRSILFCLFFTTFSCSKPRYWSHEKIHSNYPEFSYSKVTHCTPDPIHGLDLEFVQIKNQIKSYLVVHSMPVPYTPQSSKKVTINVEIEMLQTVCDAERFDGGQRFLLPEDITSTLVEDLLSKKSVMISLPGYQSHINPEGFEKKYRAMRRSFMENPFRLPF